MSRASRGAGIRTRVHGFGDRAHGPLDHSPGRHRMVPPAAALLSGQNGNICSHMVYDEQCYEAVRALLGTGLSDYAIAQRTGVNRGTVRNWRHAAAPPAAVARR